MGGGCGGYGTGDSNNDGTPNTWGDWFTDIRDGGGKNRAGARFSSGDTGGLDQNQDNYISEQEYMRGETASNINDREGIEDGRVGDAYNNSRGFVSNFSNKFGALPQGSIITEAALGPQYGTDIRTSGVAEFLQGGGFGGAAIRGIGNAIGGAQDMVMQPIQKFMPQSNEEIDPIVANAAAVNSASSIFNRDRGDIKANVLSAAMAARLRQNPQLRNRPAANADDPYYQDGKNVVTDSAVRDSSGNVRVTYRNGVKKVFTTPEFNKNFDL